MKTFFSVHLAIACIWLSTPGAVAASVKLKNGITVNGGSSNNVETFNTIPFANPPVGPLRLRKPQPFTNPSRVTTIDGTGTSPACPQISFSSANKNIIGKVANKILQIPLLDVLNGQEDCLTIDIARPAGTQAGANLPVLFWIYGGGFTTGGTQSYKGTGIVKLSSDNKQPVLFVAVNYRLGGFGFLPGKQVLAEGVGNLGLLDQRLGLQWVADNIKSFGGDPSKVTLWGESAGAISVFDQLILNGGNSSYNGYPLFRAAIMDSGSALPVNPIDSPTAQMTYDTVAKAAGCYDAADGLGCLRNLTYDKYQTATQAAPSLFAFSAEAISFVPRPDGASLLDSPEKLLAQNKIANVPIIIGDQEDEGTIFSLYQENVTTVDGMVTYMRKNLYPDASLQDLKTYVQMYEPIGINGSPFRTNALDSVYPGFRRVAAVLADSVFFGPRRAVLKSFLQNNPNTPTWAYHSTYDHELPLVGTFHATDILELFYLPVNPSNFYKTCLGYYTNFASNLNPNMGKSQAAWPLWKDNSQLLLFQSDLNNGNITDDFRSGLIGFVESHLSELHL